MRFKYTHKAPVLDCTFDEQVRVYSGGLDKSVCMYVTSNRLQSRHFYAILINLAPETHT